MIWPRCHAYIRLRHRISRSFPGKQIFSATSARFHGSVYFTDTHGNRTQPMQGVNVVARWIDPTTHQASRRYAVSSVSGFAFRGNGGNPITGFDDSIGDAPAEWGSTNSSAEGFCDMAGLAPPTSGAQYQLSVEAIDPKWPAGVGPYSPGPVSPSGRRLGWIVRCVPAGYGRRRNKFWQSGHAGDLESHAKRRVD